MLVRTMTDPHRPPDARWQLALLLVDHSRRVTSRWEDTWLREAVRFWRGWCRCGNEDDRRRLTQRMPVVSEAFALYQGTQPFTKASVEARCVAGESVNRIATACDISPEMVVACEQLFFDVRSRLAMPNLIAALVIGPKTLHGLTENDMDVILKLFALNGGSLILDQVIDFYRRPLTLTEPVDQLDDTELDDIRRRSQVKVAILFLTLPLELETIDRFLKLQERLPALEQPAKANVSARVTIQEILDILRVIHNDGEGTRSTSRATRTGSAKSRAAVGGMTSNIAGS